MAAPYLLVLAHARSGSTYLMDLLGSLKGMTALGELFHPNPKAEISEFRPLALAPHGGNGRAFAKAASEDPMAALEFLDKIPDTEMFVIKLLGHQLSHRPAREELIRNAAGLIIIRRNAFAAWTSNALVRQSRAWVGARTDEFTLTFNRESFTRTARIFSQQMAGFTRLARESGKPTVTLSYSELELIESPDALWRRVSRGIPGLPALKVNSKWKPRVKRQDNRLPIDRVGNRDEAIATLNEMGLGYLLNNNDAEDLDFLVRLFRPSLTSRILRRIGLVKK